MVPPAAVVAATRSASDSILRCGKGEWFRLQNGLAAKVILDFRLRLENRCKLFPVYALQRASILDFRPRLGNRCSAIAAAAKNGPPAAQSWGAGRDRMPRRRHNPKLKAAGGAPVPARVHGPSPQRGDAYPTTPSTAGPVQTVKTKKLHPNCFGTVKMISL